MIVEVDVAIELDEIPTDELVTELMYRRKKGEKIDLELIGMSTDTICTYLSMVGCPSDVIDMLKHWANSPVVTSETMEKWLATCEHS